MTLTNDIMELKEQLKDNELHIKLVERDYKKMVLHTTILERKITQLLNKRTP